MRVFVVRLHYNVVIYASDESIMFSVMDDDVDEKSDTKRYVKLTERKGLRTQKAMQK